MGSSSHSVVCWVCNVLSLRSPGNRRKWLLQLITLVINPLTKQMLLSNYKTRMLYMKDLKCSKVTVSHLNVNVTANYHTIQFFVKYLLMLWLEVSIKATNVCKYDLCCAVGRNVSQINLWAITDEQQWQSCLWQVIYHGRPVAQEVEEVQTQNDQKGKHPPHCWVTHDNTDHL